MADYLCDVCESMFASMEALTLHYKQDHPAEAKKFLKNVSC